MIDVNVADTIYCSPLKLICQPLDWWSSAAAWAQAVLTVLTFAIALVAQRKSQKAAEAKQDAIRKEEETKQVSIRLAAEEKQDAIRQAAEKKEDALRADAAQREAEIRAQARIDKDRNDAISALAAAIPLKTRLLDSFSIAEALATNGAVKSLSGTFKHSDRLLDLRHSAGEAARLLDASKPVLRAIYVAELLWSYLEVRKEISDADPVSISHIQRVAIELRDNSLTGINALDSILFPPK